jgi:hypothetical protein
MKQRFRQSIALFMVAVLSVLSFASVSAVIPANDDFQQTWERTDKPVSDLTVSRTWMWGPSANTTALSEEYAESPDGMRQVQYFDKSRMEINNPNAVRDLWYVTNGLLVDELIRGRIQVGDNQWLPAQPAVIPVAGDADDINGPTYAALANVLDADPLAEGVEISWRINSFGNVSMENPLTGHGVTAAFLDTETSHTVASPFWTFMNSSGTVWENGANVTANLFQNPFYATGRPITEAYWATVKVGGEVQDVLLQCFERRCLTYTPRNADGWKVEAGNVGQHYYAWRYASPTGMIFLVAPEDDGLTGIPVGCGDSLVGIHRDLDPEVDRVTGALNKLFEIKTRDFGESGLITSLCTSDLQVDSVVTTGSSVVVNLSGEYSIGGVCDEPRFTGQIYQTVASASPGATSITININGVSLDEIFNQGEFRDATVYVVSLNDGGPLGCGDTLEPWNVSFHQESNVITSALNALFGLENEDLGESGFINTLAQSDLVAESATVEAGHATVAITGTISLAGVCDNPRFIEQIRQTVLAVNGVTTADITVNETLLDDLFQPQG